MMRKLYYGWIITVTLAITETISWGIIYYAFSVFLTPMEADLGWTRSQLTAGFSIGLLVKGATAFPVGHWIDRHGARWLMTIGSLCASILIVAWSQVSDLATFYWVWAGLGMCAAMVHYEPAFTVITAWFIRYRGKALTIVTFAAGLASTIFIPLSNALLETLGWRSAILMLGISLGITTIPLHALILRRRPADLGLLPDGDVIVIKREKIIHDDFSLSDALHDRSFWLLTGAFSLAALSSAAISVHFIAFLIDKGFTASTAALIGSSIGLMKVIGRMVFAPMETRMSGHMIAAIIFTLQAIAMFVLLDGASTWIIAIYVILFGFSDGAQTLAKANITAEVFGVSHYGRISSIMAVCLTVMTTIAPLGAALLYDEFGDYNLILAITFVLALSAAGVMIASNPKIMKGY